MSTASPRFISDNSDISLPASHLRLARDCSTWHAGSLGGRGPQNDDDDDGNETSSVMEINHGFHHLSQMLRLLQYAAISDHKRSASRLVSPEADPSAAFRDHLRR